jgi:hypothetical protein
MACTGLTGDPQLAGCGGDDDSKERETKCCLHGRSIQL